MNKIKLLTITLLCAFSMNCISTMCNSNKCNIYTQTEIKYKAPTPNCGSYVCPSYCGVKHVHCDGKQYKSNILENTKVKVSLGVEGKIIRTTEETKKDE